MSRREDIDNGIWDDPDFGELGPYATLLYLWSFTNPRCGMAGLYKVRLGAMTESKVPADEIVGALQELADAGFAFYEEQVLWVRARVKHLRSRTVPIAKSIANDVARIGAGHPLVHRFVETYGGDSWLRDQLRDTLGPNLTRTSPEPHGSFQVVGKNVNLTRTSPEVLGKGQGKGRGRSTTNDKSDGNSANRVDQAALPSDFPGELADRADEVLRILTGVHAERGGNETTLRSVGLSMRRFPRRDHVSVARELEHWTLAGSGQARPLKDIGRPYATFLERAPDSAPMRTASVGGVESSAQFLARRGAT